MRGAPSQWHGQSTGIAVILVGHVTKGAGGPRVLEHMVDTVLYFEGDTHSQFRLVRAIKNRFGAVNEIGVFAMTEKGSKGVSNPSAIFLSQHSEPVPGSCVMVTLEGTPPCWSRSGAGGQWRPQSPAPVGGPGQRPPGHAAGRAAPPRRRRLMDQDVFNQRWAAYASASQRVDLAVMLSITSSLRGKALRAASWHWRGRAGR